MKKFFIFSALCTLLCFTFGLNTVHAVITLTVKKGVKIRMRFAITEEATSQHYVWVKVTGVDDEEKKRASTELQKNALEFITTGTEVKVHGDIHLFDCSSNYSNLTAIDVSQSDLWELNCSNNHLSSLDLSKNSLTHLYCSNNQFTSLEVDLKGRGSGGLMTHGKLYCDNNDQLTSLVVRISLENGATLNCTDNKKLSNLVVSGSAFFAGSLYCSNNQLSSLDVSGYYLSILGCSNNQLSSLDLSKNTSLERLYCSDNQLSNLDLSKNVNLRTLNCSGNQLSNLDLSKNVNLRYLYCSDNQLSNLDLSENVNLREIKLYANNFSTSVLNSIYCRLPVRMGDWGEIYTADGEIDRLLTMSTCEAITDAKHWQIYGLRYYDKISGIHTCGTTYALTLAPATLPSSFSYQGGEWKTTVTSTSDWKIDETTPLPDWLSVEPMQGNSGMQVTIKATPNTGTAERSAPLTFVLTNDVNTKQVVSLRQKSALLVSRSNNDALPAKGEIKKNYFTVRSSGEWEVTSDAAWCSVEPQSGNAGKTGVNLKVDTNNSKDARQATLTFTLKANEAIKKVVILEQNEASILFSPSESYTFPASGETKKDYFTVNSSGEWEVTSNAAWCSVEPQSGNAGETRLTLRVDTNNSKNARQATLTFTLKANEEIKTVVTLEQNRASISISSPEGYTFPSAGETRYFTVTSSGEWQVTSDAAWCSVASQFGYAGDTRVRIKVDANSDENERQATLTFALKDNAEIKEVITLKQEKAISVTPSEGYTFPATEETKENFFTVISSGAWEVKSSNIEWFPVVTKEGETGTTQVTIKTDANSSTLERKTELTFALKSNTAAKQVITLKQLGKQTDVIAVTPTEGYTFPAAGEMKENYFTVKSSKPWEVTSSNTAWFPVEMKEGEAGTTQVTIKTEANSSKDERSTTLTFALKDKPDVKQDVVVKQEAKPTIEVTPAEGYTFLAAGETKENYFTVESSGAWKVTSSNAEWFPVETKEGETGTTQITIKADANNNATERNTTLTFALKDNAGIKQEVVIKQEGPSIKVKPAEGYTFPATGETKENYFIVESTAAWKVTSSNADWFPVEMQEGNAGTTKVTITAEANNGKAGRQTELTFALKANAEVKQVVILKQKGALLVTPIEEYTFPASGETKTNYFTVESAGAWKVTCSNADWFPVETKEGEAGTTKVTIKADANNKKEERSTELTFALKDNVAIKQVVTLKQKGASIAVTPAEGYTFPYAGETKSFSVESSGAWMVTASNTEWLTIEPKSGAAGTTTVTFKAEANNKKEERSTELTFALKDHPEIKQVVTVKQAVNPNAVEDVLFAGISVAPNPFSSQLKIENREALLARYELVNTNGVIVRKGMLEGVETLLNTEELKAGVYLLRILSGIASKTLQVVKE